MKVLITLEPDAQGGYGRDAKVVGHCPNCDFSITWPNYLIAAELLAHRDVEEHVLEAHFFSDRYDRLVRWPVE